MKHLHLLVPDLFPPPDVATEVCAGLDLGALETILARSRASASTSTSPEDWLCAAFVANGLAPVRAAADGVAVGADYWLCADPVSLQLRHAQVLLLPDAAPTDEEAAALCASLNEHFAAAGLTFHAPQPRHWYVQLGADPHIVTSPLRQVAWQDAKLHQPQGPDALRWQRIATEIQMLLHAHPVNQARQARGGLTINALWLWGGGRAARLQRPYDAMGGDGELAGTFADAAGIPQPAGLKAMLGGAHDNALWLCEEPGEALRRGDLHAWGATVQRLEHECAQPLLKALRSGHLGSLSFEVVQGEGGRRFDLTRFDAWRFWRAKRPLARYAR